MRQAGPVEDPRGLVEAPVRRELQWLVVRGLALFTAVAALATWPVVCTLDARTCDALAMTAPLLLFAYALTVRARRLILGPVPEHQRASAWERAREVDADDATLGRLVCGWVPIGLLAALVLLVWPHITDANPALACAWVVIGLPPIAVAWLVASSTWLDSAREGLARAELRSDALLRSYWANLGR
jgi:hypothetical protein